MRDPNPAARCIGKSSDSGRDLQTCRKDVARKVVCRIEVWKDFESADGRTRSCCVTMMEVLRGREGTMRCGVVSIPRPGEPCVSKIGVTSRTELEPYYNSAVIFEPAFLDVGKREGIDIWVTSSRASLSIRSQGIRNE